MLLRGWQKYVPHGVVEMPKIETVMYSKTRIMLDRGKWWIMNIDISFNKEDKMNKAECIDKMDSTNQVDKIDEKSA